ncbi:TnsA-like heteromeric transposase endonuclease subunit [Streptomyces sp. NBC_00846]|uniref:TnsA-like heteromeric transposase endonuclease subunit n=1 Tax=Streptomyces sp. NBC_00846 TaxID=2975849 RepID=UPI003866003D|nr:TnsA-like heteromeric transposase endonuclease subunit [Streptomyces sp. NBC_00846]
MDEPAEAVPAWDYASDFQVGFVGVDGAQRLGLPARYRVVDYESCVERDAAMALDFDPAIMALTSQPFRLVWPNGGRDREHTPDYFARSAGGTAVVVDVRPENLVDEEAAAVFAFTARICGSVGWQFWLVGDLGQPFRANLRRLARYRHPRCCRAPVADRLRKVFGEPRRLLTGAERVGDRSADVTGCRRDGPTGEVVRRAPESPAPRSCPVHRVPRCSRRSARTGAAG